jgi:pilus assembly protein CpaF
VFNLGGEQLTVGRDSTNEIVINDAEISRRHARLTFQGGKYILEDLGSTNGTFVNGQRLAGPRVLKAGEVVSFGEQIVLVYEASTFDPAATVASPRAAAVPSISRPAPPPPPLPAEYAGSVPASPAPAIPDAARKISPSVIYSIVGVSLIVCCCIGTLFVVDYLNIWCTFPFSIIAQVLSGPGVCP